MSYRRAPPHTISCAAVHNGHDTPATQEQTRIVFGVDAIVLRRNGTTVVVTVDALNGSGVHGIASVEHLVVVIHCSSIHLTSVFRLDLSHITSLRTLTIVVEYDTDVNDNILTAWRGILAILRSLPETTRIGGMRLTIPVPHRVLRTGWTNSALVRDLAQTLYSVDHRLVALVDRAPLQRIDLVCPAGEHFTSADWNRVRAFLPALYDYSMLRF